MTVRDLAADLQIDALLHEIAGVQPAPDLAARIAAACARHRPASAFRNGRRAWAAALLVAGALVVGAVAWQRADRKAAAPPPAPAPQDPAPGPVVPRGHVTLVADYSDNRVYEIDEQGREVFALEEVYGAWDAERLADGNLLLTEFSVSHVREVDRNGKTVWLYDKLKNPYDADRLDLGALAGMTLICDTFGGRVVVVKPDGTEYWSYGDHDHESIRPFDCDLTAKGTFLIADVLHDRIVEIDMHGFVLWEAKDLPNAHDADRLPNGNTLVTLRHKGAVVELDRDGKVVWQLADLSTPSDADRLPNGHTLVAEKGRVREFDRDGKVVGERAATWAVEVNRYAR